MTSFEQELESGLEDLASGVHPEAIGARVISKAKARGTTTRWRNRGLAFGLGVAAAAAVVGFLANANPSTRHDLAVAGADPGRVTGATTGTSDGLHVVEPGEPCPGARHAATIASLATTSPIWAPVHGQLTDAWTCGSTPVLMYGQIQISYEGGWDKVDAAQEFASLARDYGGSVQTILGRQAYVHPSDAEGPRNSVQLVSNGTLVRLLAGSSVPIGNLVALAKDLPLPSS